MVGVFIRPLDKKLFTIEISGFLPFLLNRGFWVNIAKITKNSQISIANNFLSRGRMGAPTI